MLTAEERHEIDAAVRQAPYARAACIDALLVVQRHRGFVGDDALADLAQALDATIHELESVATFYNLIFRRPVGRHVILLCDSISCWIMGYEAIRDALRRKLGIDFGETTSDGRFTLLTVPCLGACDRAPALMIDEDLHGGVTEEGLREILERYP
jgi:NADH-quinone oxidoreductase subunit E